MKYGKVILFSILITIPINCIAQESRIDSLRSIMMSAEDDSLKVNTLNNISNEIFNSSPDEAYQFANESVDLARRLDYPKGLAYGLKEIGRYNHLQGDYVEAMDNWQQSLGIFERIEDDLGAANLYSNMGSIYSDWGDEPKATEYYLRSLKLSEELGDSLRIATALVNLGYVFSNNAAEFDKAIEYNQQALNIAELIDYQEAIGVCAFNLGEIYFQQKEYDSALIYFEKSKKADEGTVYVANSLNYIGRVFTEKGNYNQAIEFQNEAIDIAKKYDANLELVKAYLGLANTYNQQHHIKNAKDYYLLARDLSENTGFNYELKDAYGGLAAIHAEIKDFRNAYSFQRLFSVLSDSLYSIESNNSIKDLQLSFEIDKKLSEIEILEQQSEIEQLKTKRQKIIKNASLGSLGFVVIIAFILYRNYRNKIKINKILDKQNHEIEGLLLNILPKETAKELQQDGYATPRYYESVSVLFTDFIGFTKIAEGLKPHELIAELNSYFNAFDDIIEKYHLEKIKTIGDAYMCAGGIPTPNTTHPCRIVKAGLAMQDYMAIKNEQRAKVGKQPWGLRVGIHTGPVVAGVVGNKKYAYDIWGDTVNIASRMESKGEAGKVNISAATFALINNNYECQYRGKIAAKNKGNVDMYFIEKEKETTEAL